MRPLPIDPLLPEIVRQLKTARALVLQAPPGAGKTTRVPRALLDAGFEGEIVVLEPRRIAARMAARRVAEELGESIGDAVGYTVRFEDASSKRTRIRFVTEGVLTRWLLGERGTRGMGVVLLDEFHERHLQGDLALALLRARPELKLVVMSATLATEPIARYLEAPTLRAEGRLFEIAVEHLDQADERPLHSQIASALRRLVNEGLQGDVLVFLPGAAEIRRAREACEKIAAEADLLLVPLHGDLPPAEQDRAVQKSDRRKVILSTNVAESSVTIEGVVAVIDSGLSRVASHAPWSGLPTLKVERISRASATQRAGRAGRTRPGRCLRLYTKHDFETRPEHDAPEIRRTDLAQTYLELSAAGIDEVAWLEPPPEASVRAARTLLRRLGALDEGVTRLGRRMASFGVHPRAARILAEAERRHVIDEACVVAALLGERDIREASRARFGDAQAKHGATERSDLIAMLDAFREAREARFAAHALRAIGLDPGATQAVERARSQLRRCFDRVQDAHDPDAALLQCVLAGYPDRVARRVRGRTLALGGGGSAELSETSAVRDAEWMVTAAADERGRGVLVRIASAIEPEWLIDLFPESVVESKEVRLEGERVVASDRIAYDGLVLHESPCEATGAEVARALAGAALAKGPRAFCDGDALDRFLSRLRFVAGARKDVSAPSDEEVKAALVELCDGRSSFEELRHADLLGLLRQRAGRVDLERLAPDRIPLLGGRFAQVHYDDGKPPWAESYLQDFFGMKETPAVAGVPLTLHLWAPNRRAVQVTSDLSGFWQKHYPSIRKELMRKYPRHSWPEDPTVPTPRFRPRT